MYYNLEIDNFIPHKFLLFFENSKEHSPKRIKVSESSIPSSNHNNVHNANLNIDNYEYSNLNYYI